MGGIATTQSHIEGGRANCIANNIDRNQPQSEQARAETMLDKARLYGADVGLDVHKATVAVSIAASGRWPGGVLWVMRSIPSQP